MEDYKKYSDEELIDKLRSGAAEIMDYILGKYKPLVRKKAKALYLIGGDTDDLIQEGMIGLFKAIRDYQPEKEAFFGYFADICITRQMYTAVEASQRKKHAPLNSYISLYEESKENGVPLMDVLTGVVDENPEHMVIRRENLDQKLKELTGNLSKMEMQVFCHTMEGLDYKQIADTLHKSPKTIDNALQRIRMKFEKQNSQ